MHQTRVSLPFQLVAGAYSSSHPGFKLRLFSVRCVYVTAMLSSPSILSWINGSRFLENLPRWQLCDGFWSLWPLSLGPDALSEYFHERKSDQKNIMGRTLLRISEWVRMNCLSRITRFEKRLSSAVGWPNPSVAEAVPTSRLTYKSLLNWMTLHHGLFHTSASKRTSVAGRETESCQKIVGCILWCCNKNSQWYESHAGIRTSNFSFQRNSNLFLSQDLTFPSQKYPRPS